MTAYDSPFCRAELPLNTRASEPPEVHRFSYRVCETFFFSQTVESPLPSDLRSLRSQTSSFTIVRLCWRKTVVFVGLKENVGGCHSFPG
ncbi:hypothetical protein NDU88_005801 [Pleurodeles waltl]|uniref:Uncharacterized protein n=1 Tax=Pleurodeles waltl TaxID=8319 RepID=A0AAV7RPE9_PLEWA|nr:hypothetical protein NDU88_005801 [Pleurodeles waltl]